MEPTDACIFEIRGGRAGTTKATHARTAIVCVLVVIIVCVIYKFYQRYYCADITSRYARLSGDADNEEARELIAAGKRLRNPTPMDNLHIGSTLLIALNDKEAAQTHLAQALQQIATQVDEGKTTADTPYILNRIADLTEAYDVDLDVQDALFAYYDGLTDWGARRNLVMQRHETRGPHTNPADIVAPLGAAIAWHSDSQNVHDSLINSELSDQYKKLREENRTQIDLHDVNYNHAAAWLRERFADDPRREDMLAALQMFDNNYPMPTLGADIREQDVVGEVWKRIHDSRNEENFNKLREAFADGVVDCVEKGNVVCIDGRTKKVFQSLAHLDVDPDMGLFHSKTMLRNEMLSRASEVIDSYVGASGSAPYDVITEYLAGNPKNREDVVALEDEMRKAIADIGEEYRDKLPEGEIRTIVAECQDVV